MMSTHVEAHILRVIRWVLENTTSNSTKKPFESNRQIRFSLQHHWLEQDSIYLSLQSIGASSIKPLVAKSKLY